jgi:hypothetical protein
MARVQHADMTSFPNYVQWTQTPNLTMMGTMSSPNTKQIRTLPAPCTSSRHQKAGRLYKQGGRLNPFVNNYRPQLFLCPVTPTFAVLADSVEHTDLPSPPPSPSAQLPQRQEAPHPSILVPFNSSLSTQSDPHCVISSPLDQPSVTAFASLALGGEYFNG